MFILAFPQMRLSQIFNCFITLLQAIGRCGLGMVMLSLTSQPLLAHEKSHQQRKHFAQHAAFDASGTLWRVRVVDDFVLVDRSQDGSLFEQAVKVNTSAQRITASNEARPEIAVGPNGHIYVVWTESLVKPFTGDVWFARSINAGKSFEKPFVLHQDRAEITHAFATINVSSKGVVTVAWIDKRDAIAAKKSGKNYAGAAIYYVQSFDQAKTFTPDAKLADASCECCRLAVTNKPDGTATVLWRGIYADNERDHMLAEIPKNNLTPNVVRASFGHWKIDGCPHHGGAITNGGEGNDWWGYHMAYYDGQDKKPGLYYARMDGVAWATSVPKRIGNSQHQAGHPALLSIAQNVWLVWREIKAGRHEYHAQYSSDDGKNWTEAKLISQSNEALDYPQLIRQDNRAYLIVNKMTTGMTLLAMPEMD